MRLNLKLALFMLAFFAISIVGGDETVEVDSFRISFDLGDIDYSIKVLDPEESETYGGIPYTKYTIEVTYDKRLIEICITEYSTTMVSKFGDQYNYFWSEAYTRTINGREAALIVFSAAGGSTYFKTKYSLESSGWVDNDGDFSADTTDDDAELVGKTFVEITSYADWNITRRLLNTIEVSSAGYWYNEGLLFHIGGEFAEALGCYNKSLEIDSTDSSIWNLKGNALSSLDRYEEAIECYNASLELNSSIGVVWKNKAIALESMDRYEEAIECYNKSIELDPTDEKVWARKGNALGYMGRYEEAIECFDRSLELDPSGDIWSDKGSIFYLMGRYEEAIECFNMSLEIDPLDNGIWLIKGLAFESMGRYEEAIECYNTSIEIDSLDNNVWLIKGHALEQMGRKDEAIQCYNNSQIEAWASTFGEADCNEEAKSIRETMDGGFIVTGGKYFHEGANSWDVLLIKTDSYGTETWSKVFGGYYDDSGESVCEISDEGFIVVGGTKPIDAAIGDILLIKTDSEGEEIWNKTFGGNEYEWGNSVSVVGSCEFVIVGGTISYGVGEKDVWLIKTDSEGNEIWNKTFGGSGNDWGISIDETVDEGFILTGWTESQRYEKDVLLIRADSYGNEMWSKRFGGANDDWGHSVQETHDGGFISQVQQNHMMPLYGIYCLSGPTRRVMRFGIRPLEESTRSTHNCAMELEVMQFRRRVIMDLL